MAYIKYSGNPNEVRVNKSFANLCDTNSQKNSLRLFNQCFNVYAKDQTIASFCDLSNFTYPVDGHLYIDFEVCAGDTLVLFDNALDLLVSDSPDAVSEDKQYVRGYLAYVYYPTLDSDGADIEPKYKTCTLTFINRTNQQFSIPLFTFTSHFCNPESRDPDDLINKVEITNPHSNFSIKVRALLIYVKSSLDIKNCDC